MDVWNWFQELIEIGKNHKAKRRYFYLVDWIDYYIVGYLPEEVVDIASEEPEWESVCKVV